LRKENKHEWEGSKKEGKGWRGKKQKKNEKTEAIILGYEIFQTKLRSRLLE